MCGLIGGTGEIESRYMVALGCLAADRGRDSAGVAWQVQDRLRLAKVAKNPRVAYPVDLAPALRHAAKFKAPVIGHTRQATQGVINARNAHPFMDEKSQIAWAHNGIIINDQDFGTFEVDSECLIGGIKKRDFSPYHGPIALLWIEEGKLHAFRKGNPLHRGVRRGAVYLASEGNMLKEIGCHRIKELSEGFIYTWKGNAIETTLRVPFHDYYQTGTANRGNYDFSREAPCGYTPSNYRVGHSFFIRGDWHNHTIRLHWSNTCYACNPTGFPDEDEPKIVTGAAEDDRQTHLIPIRHGSAEHEAIISQIEEREEPPEVDGKELCHNCHHARHATNSAWCEDCLGIFQGGY